MKPRKRVRRTTEVTETEETQNPLSQLVRSYLETGVYPDELQPYQFKIDVQRYNREGKPVRITNAVYDNLEELPDRLGSRFGKARFRLFVSIADETGKKVAFVRIEDFEIESEAPAAAEPGQTAADHQDGDGRRSGMLELQALKMQQDHATFIKLLEQNTQIVIAALSAKTASGGGGLSQLVQAVKLGASMAAGSVPADDGDAGAAADEGANIMGLLANPLIQKLAGAIIDGVDRGRPAGPGAAPGGPAQQQPQGMNGTD